MADTETPQDAELHPLQEGRGVVKYYRSMMRGEKAYRLINEVYQGKRQMPILSCPLGGDQPPLEFDIHAFVKHIQDDTMRQGRIEAMLVDWNNYYGGEYLKHLANLDKFAKDLHHSLIGVPELPTERQINSFEESIDDIHTAYAEFEPLWKKYEAGESEAEEVEDPMLTLPDGSIVSLSNILGAADVTDPGVVARVTAGLGASQKKSLMEVMTPCLKNLVMKTATAMQHVKNSGQ